MLIFTFILATLSLLIQGILIPKLTLLAYAPFLAWICLRLSLHRALFFALLAGCVMDLFSVDPMGLHALNYTITTACLFKIRKPFSFENSLHFCFFSSLVSIFATVLHWLLLFLFDQKIPWDGKWMIVDFFVMPVLDGLYAFVWFAAPLTLSQYVWKILMQKSECRMQK